MKTQPNVNIKFGTSGWRGIIAEDFTFHNARLAAQGTALYLKEELANKSSPIYGRKPLVIIGHDSRFQGRAFALAVAETLANEGLQPLLCEDDAPTPVIAFSIRDKKAIGGINMTASHNPAEYQGFKFSVHNGAGAPPEATKVIEAHIKALQKSEWKPKSITPPELMKVKTFNPKPAYFRQLKKLVNFDAIRSAGLKIVVELMYGAGRGYLDTLLTEEAGAQIFTLHGNRNPGFGGHHPEPNAEGMIEAAALLKKEKAHLALGLDGDADRFGIVDKNGTWLSPNQILALALYHLKKNRGWSGSAVRSVPTSHQIDSVAALYGITLRETPVGFKYIGGWMEQEPVIVGGEESGGLSVQGHIPEKDGVLACLLMAELVAMEGKTLSQILKNLERKTGPFFTDRINVKIQAEKKQELLDRLSKGLDKIGSYVVQEMITTDGFKFLLPNQEWVAFRASGTEPMIRCYIEAKSESSLKKLQTACKKTLQG